MYKRMSTDHVADHEEAVLIADKLFSPFKTEESVDRTTDAVKIRIKKCSSKRGGGYNVVVAKKEKVAQEASTPVQEAKKKQTRDRNDRKGRKTSE